jgi:hypothetical protein
MTKIEYQLDAAKAMEFILAGKAIFTLVSQKTGVRYTYRVKKAENKSAAWPDLWFVSVLTGPDNMSSYVYIGKIQNGKFQLTVKSRMSAKSAPVVAFDWTWTRLVAGVLPEAVEIWHAGRCGRCGKVLTVPTSIESGYGPECITLLAA